MIRTQWAKGRTVRIKDGWQDAGKRGVILCKPIHVGQLWIAVRWDGEEDPDWFKARGLEIVIQHRTAKSRAQQRADTAAKMRAAGELRNRHRDAVNVRWSGGV